MHAFHGQRTLQAFQHNHADTAGPAVDDLRPGQRRILSGNTETACLMTGRAVGRENLLATLGRSELDRLLRSAGAGWPFFAVGRPPGVQSIAAEISGITAEIGAAEENRESVNPDQPNRERLQTDARLGFLTLNGGVHFCTSSVSP